MAITNRTVTIKEIFASTANTTIPNPPVVGDSYRNEGTTATEIGKGWAYKNIVDSAKFNEAMYEYSTICKQLEKYGYLPWSDLTDYETGSVCLGTNGTVYQAVQNTGPSTTAYDPVNDTSHTYWRILFTDIPNYFLSMMEIIYPVGSLYFGTQSSCPLALVMPGTTWELLPKDKAIWTGDGTNGNTTIAAGLPNHTHAFGRQSTQNNGSFVWNNQNEDYVLGTRAGSIYYNGSGEYNYQRSYDAGASVNESLGNTYTLSTSLAKTDNLASDGVWGNSTTVQPPAIVVNVWRRTA